VKTYVSEISDSTNQAKSFGFLSLFGGLGMIMGPMVGGYFSQPSKKYPSLFPKGSLLDIFPFLLPNLISAGLTLVCLIFGYIHLTETLPPTKYTELKEVNHMEVSSDEDKSEDDKIEGKLDVGSSDDDKEPMIEHEDKQEEDTKQESRMQKFVSYIKKKVGVLGSKEVLLTTGLLSTYGFSSCAYSEVFPLWTLLPVSQGGLGFSSDDIGTASTIGGITILMFNLLLYFRIVGKIGLVRTFRYGSLLLVFIYMCYPEVPNFTISGKHYPDQFFLPPQFAMWMLLGFCLVSFWCARQMQFTSITQLVSNSILPNQMGAVNGMAQSLIALTRLFAPPMASTMLAWSVTHGNGFLVSTRFVFYFLSITSVLTWVLSFWLPISLNKPKREV